MGTRTVTGTLKHLDGTAWASASVVFYLMEGFETSTEVYPAEKHTETTDVDGAFSITLGVPDTGTAQYRIALPDGTTPEVYLATGAPVDLVTLITISGTAVAQDDLQTLLDAAELLTIQTITGAAALNGDYQHTRAVGTFAITLPVATLTRRAFSVINKGTGTITITPNGADTINGETTWTLAPMASVTLIDGAVGEWDA